MAGEQNGNDAPGSRLEVEIARPKSVQTDPQAGTSEVRDLASTTAEFDMGGGLGPEDQDEPEGSSTEQPGGDTPEPEPEGEPSGDAPEALPDFDPDNEEVSKAYDERYFTDSGEVNLETLTAEFDANKGEGLNAGTYAFLKDRLGLSDAAVKQIEQGQVALRQQADTGFYSKIEGGKDAYESAIKWATDGKGYSDAQKEAYNKAHQQGGAAFEDAVEALMTRFGKANPGAIKPAAQRGPRGVPQRRASSPARDVTGGARAGGGGPASGERFASQAEHSQAFNAALGKVRDAKASGDKAAIRAAEAERDAVSAKGRRGYGR